MAENQLDQAIQKYTDALDTLEKALKKVPSYKLSSEEILHTLIARHEVKGEKLNLGDLLRVAKGVKVVIQCNVNKTNWIVPDDGLPWGLANTCSPPERKQAN